MRLPWELLLEKSIVHVLRNAPELGLKDSTPLSDQDVATVCAPHVKNLWKLFNTRRPNQLPAYMSNQEFAMAYLASYTLANAVRVRRVLDQSRTLERMFPQLQKEQSQVDVLDFGAGPLSASLAALSFIAESIMTSGEKIPQTVHVNLTVIERSPMILSLGRQLTREFLEALQPSLPPQSKLTYSVQRTRLEDCGSRQYDLVLATNVLNELSQQLQAKLADCLSQQAGFILLLEPGQDVHARNLAAFRDRLLKKKELKIESPCPHTRICPLGPGSGRKDWCWFREDWKPTPWTRRLGHSTELDQRQLNSSFVLFSSTKSSKEKSRGTTTWARCVSDPIKIPKAKEISTRKFLAANQVKLGGATDTQQLLKNLPPQTTPCKSLLCSDDGRLLGCYAEPSRLPTRGQPIHQPEKSWFAAQEKTGGTPNKRNVTQTPAQRRSRARSSRPYCHK